MRFVFVAVIVVSLVSQFSIANAATIVSRNQNQTRVRATELNDKSVRFELCTGDVATEVCQVIGDERGYTRRSIANKIEILQSSARNRTITDILTVVGSVAVGAGYGLMKNPGYSSDAAFDFTPLVRVWNAGKFTILGGLAGSGVVVGRYFFDTDPAGARDALSNLASVGTDPSTVLIINEDMGAFVSALNYALMGI